MSQDSQIFLDSQDLFQGSVKPNHYHRIRQSMDPSSIASTFIFTATPRALQTIKQANRYHFSAF